jgi:hypothetical protein
MVQSQSIKSGGQELTVASRGRRTMPMIPAESMVVAAGRPDSARRRRPVAAGPTVSRASQGRPQVGPKDREAPLTRPAGAVGAAGRP